MNFINNKGFCAWGKQCYKEAGEASLRESMARPNNVKLLQSTLPRTTIPVPSMKPTTKSPEGFYDKLGMSVSKNEKANFEMRLRGKPDKKLLQRPANERIRVPAPRTAPRKQIEKQALTDTDWRDTGMKDILKSELTPERYLDLVTTIVKILTAQNQLTELAWWQPRQLELQRLNAKRMIYQKQGREVSEIDINREMAIHNEIDARLLANPVLMGNIPANVPRAPAPAPSAPPGPAGPGAPPAGPGAPPARVPPGAPPPYAPPAGPLAGPLAAPPRGILGPRIPQAGPVAPIPEIRVRVRGGVEPDAENDRALIVRARGGDVPIPEVPADIFLRGLRRPPAPPREIGYIPPAPPTEAPPAIRMSSLPPREIQNIPIPDIGKEIRKSKKQKRLKKAVGDELTEFVGFLKEHRRKNIPTITSIPRGTAGDIPDMLAPKRQIMTETDTTYLNNIPTIGKVISESVRPPDPVRVEQLISDSGMLLSDSGDIDEMEEEAKLEEDPFEQARAEDGMLRDYPQFSANDYRRIMLESRDPTVQRVWRELGKSYKDTGSGGVGKKRFIEAVNKKLTKYQFGSGMRPRSKRK